MDGTTRYMDENKSFAPYNKDKQPHGHWVIYHKRDNEFWYECHYVNGVEHGYEKWGNGEIFYHAL
jgi:hypothetical protein